MGKIIIGYCLVASPLVALFAFIVVTDSLLVACGLFAFTAAIIGVIAGGIKLIDS